MLGALLVAPEVQVALMGAKRNDMADLRADAEDARLEAANAVARSAVACELLVNVSRQTDMRLLAQEL